MEPLQQITSKIRMPSRTSSTALGDALKNIKDASVNKRIFVICFWRLAPVVGSVCAVIAAIYFRH